MKINNYKSPGRQALILALLSLLMWPIGAFASLSGKYTIDPSGSATSTNYQNFASAMGDLASGTRTDGGTANGSGVSGPVTIEVADGTYTETISMGPVTGASSTNTIMFYSKSMDSTKVILTSASSAAASPNYTLQLVGADWLTFKQIGFERSGTALYAMVIAMNSGANNNTFMNCFFKGKYEASTSAIGFTGGPNSIVYSIGNDTGNLFLNNHFLYGYNAIYMSGADSSNKVIGNIMDTMGCAGVYVLNQTRFQMKNNLVRLGAFPASSGHYVCYGIRLEGGRKFEISGNYFFTVSNASVCRTMVLFNSVNTFDHPGLITNNFAVVSAGSSSSTGIALGGNRYVNIINNNILVNSSPTNSAAFYIYPGSTGQPGGTGFLLYNNNFINKGTGYAMSVEDYTSSIDSADHNNLYTLGSWLGNYGGTKTKNLADWQIASALDSHSLSVDPAFKSKMDLHVSNGAINAKGYSFSNITTDIDGDIRSTTPDIGADEFTPASLDAGVSLLDSPVAYCAGKHYVSVQFANYGSAALTGVDIHWSVNGTAQTTYVWTGSTASGTSSPSIILGTYTFSNNTPYTIKAWTTNPNGGTDANSINDTLVEIKRSALNGTYTIGGGSPDFAVLNDAVTALNLRGVCGPVVFNIRDGNYNEQLNMIEFAGVTATSPVTFQGQSGDSSKVVVWLAASNATGTNNALMQLLGTDYFTFRHMTFQRTGTFNQASVIDIKGGAMHNTFTHCRFLGLKIATTGTTYNIISSLADGDHYNTFTNNLIRHGAYGFSFSGSSGDEDMYTTFANNVMDSSYAGGMLCQNSYFLNVNNNMLNSNSALATYKGMSFDACDSSLRVSRNMLKLSSAASGIEITNIAAPPSNAAIVDNNFVAITNSGSTSGIYDNNNTGVKIIFNNVNLYGASNTGSAFAINGGAGANIIFDNIFANQSNSGFAMDVTGGIDSTDYNDYYSANSGNAIRNTSGTSLSSWQASSGRDKNSIATNPGFTSNTDLHISTSSLRAGIPVPPVNVDIDGNPRSTSTPTIGADELAPVGLDAGISALVNPGTATCAGSQNVQVTLSNLASTVLTSATINWSMNGTPQTAVNWTGSLNYGGTTTITLGTYTFTTGSNILKAFSSKPNGGTDVDATNDTLKTTITGYSKPTAAITGSTSACATSLSIYSAGTTTNTYKWVISGGSVAAGAGTSSIAVSWGTAGSGSVRLVESNAGGCVDSTTTSVTINSLPVPVLSLPKSFCENAPTLVTAASHTGSSYAWVLTNGSVSAGAGTNSITASFKAGSASIKVIETNSAGCKDSTSSTFSVLPGPKPVVSGTASLCIGATATYKTPMASGNTYSWSVSGGSITSATNTDSAVVNWTSAGAGSINVMESNASGCSITAKYPVTVNALPIATWTKTKVAPRSYMFRADDTSNIAGTTYVWDLGDGTNGSAYKIAHIYAKDSTYQLSLKVTKNGCSATYNDTMKVFTGIATYEAPAGVTLGVYPNPFNAQATVSYSLAQNAHVRLSLVDMNGRVIILNDNTLQTQGSYTFPLDAVKQNMGAGLYLLRMEVDNNVITKQIVRLK